MSISVLTSKIFCYDSIEVILKSTAFANYSSCDLNASKGYDFSSDFNLKIPSYNFRVCSAYYSLISNELTLRYKMSK